MEFNPQFQYGDYITASMAPGFCPNDGETGIPPRILAMLKERVGLVVPEKHRDKGIVSFFSRLDVFERDAEGNIVSELSRKRALERGLWDFGWKWTPRWKLNLSA